MLRSTWLLLCTLLLGSVMPSTADGDGGAKHGSCPFHHKPAQDEEVHHPHDDVLNFQDSSDAHNYEDPKLYDISVAYKQSLPVFKSDKGLPETFKSVVSDMSKGGNYYSTEFCMNVHSGTHIDSPAHFLKEEWDAGNHIDKLDLEALVGPALVLEVYDSNITAAALEKLNIPFGTDRILFKTDNTKRNLMGQTAFASDYVAFTEDGAKWLAEHTAIRLVGIDYLSIATLPDLVSSHQALLRKGIIPVEGLNLTSLQGGRVYHVTCLPLNIVGSEGAPARCIAYGPEYTPPLDDHLGNDFDGENLIEDHVFEDQLDLEDIDFGEEHILDNEDEL